MHHETTTRQEDYRMNRLRILFSSISGFILRYYLLFILAFAAYRAATIHVRFWNGMIWSDAEGYYLYLPALFINGGFEDLYVRTEGQFPCFLIPISASRSIPVE